MNLIFAIQSKQSWIKDYCLLSLVILISYLLFLGDRPLFTPDEGRYAEIAREMIASHNYISPRLNHILYFEKPALFYWLLALAMNVAGTSLWTVRSVNVILALFGCLSTYTFTRQIFGRHTGLLAAFIQASCLLYFVMSHMVTLDLAVSVFISISLMSCFLSLNEWSQLSKLSLLSKTQPYAPHKANIYFYLATCFASLAVLTKGLIGLIFPGMIALSWMIISNNLRCLRHIPWVKATLLFIFITAPWHILVQLKHPEFLNFYFLNQQILRYTQKGIGHYQPASFFIPYLALGLFPWTCFLIQTIIPIKSWWNNKHAYSAEIYLFLATILIFLFFSFSKSKLIPYILPLIPFTSILIARYLINQIKQKQYVGIRLGFILFTISAILTAYFINPKASLLLSNHPKITLFWVNITTWSFLIISLMTLIISFKNTKLAIYSLIPVSLILAICFMQCFSALDTRTIAPLAQKLLPILKPQDEVIAYNKYYQDLPFYLERRISVLNWRNELSFGMQLEDTSNWMINNEIFIKRFNDTKRVYVIIEKNALRQLQLSHPHIKTIVLATTVKDVLITNLPLDKLSY